MTALDEAAVAVAEAVETPNTVASHLHPGASYDLADHPRPTGLEEVWRFTPLKRLRGLLDAAPAVAGSDGQSAAHLDWQVDAPDQVTISTISTSEAIALGGPAPVDRIAAFAVANSDGAVRIDIPAEAELDRPVLATLTGRGIDQPCLLYTSPSPRDRS